MRDESFNSIKIAPLNPPKGGLNVFAYLNPLRGGVSSCLATGWVKKSGGHGEVVLS